MLQIPFKVDVKCAEHTIEVNLLISGALVFQKTKINTRIG